MEINIYTNISPSHQWSQWKLKFQPTKWWNVLQFLKFAVRSYRRCRNEYNILFASCYTLHDFPYKYVLSSCACMQIPGRLPPHFFIISTDASLTLAFNLPARPPVLSSCFRPRACHFWNILITFGILKYFASRTKGIENGSDRTNFTDIFPQFV